MDETAEGRLIWPIACTVAGMKKLNDWPTFPQIIVNGELFGGLDILNESIETGEFAEVKAGLVAA